MKITKIVKIAVLSGSFIITPVVFSSSNQALSVGNKMMLAGHYGHNYWKYNNSWKYHNYHGKKIWWKNGYHGWHKGYKYNNWYYKGKYGPYKHWKHYSPYPYY
ncbi:Uncharacterised protein [Legionella busanensis]|uniref:Uncharacterized protein n=1 Tax=Legionella busanensis TaxID=190655 RepID=A0A378JIJ4_9GAMM|nr:hypothetical protein [Legionella busanensis]STX50060.1 Uncharacterised protein [Legionella busanensis]